MFLPAVGAGAGGEAASMVLGCVRGWLRNRRLPRALLAQDRPIGRSYSRARPFPDFQVSELAEFAAGNVDLERKPKIRVVSPSLDAARTYAVASSLLASGEKKGVVV